MSNNHRQNRVHAHRAHSSVSFRTAWRSAALLALLLLAFAPNALALRITPNPLHDKEGSVIQVNVVIAVDDWVRPNDDFSKQCNQIGVNAKFVTRFFLKRVNGSATYGSSASYGDLHMVSGGKPKSDIYILWCYPGTLAAEQIDSSVSLDLHADDLDESAEAAELELYKVDLTGKKTFVSSTAVLISNVNGAVNMNECSSAAIGGDTPVKTGSIANSDCDDSPRGPGYLADQVTFSGTQGESIAIEAAWQGMDGYLYLEAPDGRIEDEDDDYLSSTGSRIARALNQTGTYTVWVTTKNKNATGSYEISLNHEGTGTDDWQFSSVAITPSVLVTGDALSIAVSGRNTGASATAATDEVDIVYVLSADAEISASDQILGTGSYCCGTGFEGAWQGEVSVAPGTYWAGACITTADDEPSNNCTAGTEVQVAASSACNRRTLDCGGAMAGNLGEASCTVGPQGPDYKAEEFRFTGAAGSTVWLDASWEFDGYLVLKNPQGQVVAENDSDSSELNSHIEHRLESDGTYTLWASSYEPGATGAYEVALECDPPAGPDLTLDMPQLPAEWLVPGQSLELTAALTNSGDQPSDSTTLRYVLSSDEQIDPSDPEIGSDGASGLHAGESSSHTMTLAAPGASGPFWVGVCADPVPGEASLTNNCSAGTRIEIRAQPECTVSSTSCGKFLTGELSDEDCSGSPRGTGFPGEALELNLESGRPLVADASWYGFDGYLLLEGPSGEVVALNDDQTDQQHSRIEYAARSSGVHRLWAASASRGATGTFGIELTCGVVSAPDLVAADISVSATEVETGDSIDLEITVANEGNSTAESSQIHFMLSTDEDISSDDIVLASQELEPVPAHSSVPGEVTLTLPQEPGHYWLGFCVDSVINEMLNDNNCLHLDNSNNAVEVQGSPVSATDALQQRQHQRNLVRVSGGAACSGSALSCGQASTGALDSSDCDRGPHGTGYLADVHTVSGTAGEVLSLNIGWTGLDGYVYLEDPTGAVVAGNDDFEDSGHSRIETRLEKSGTYRVWASAQSQGQSGSYEIDVTCDAPTGPDLLAGVPQLGAATVRAGQFVSLSTEVVNEGLEISADTQVQFILASSPDISSGNRANDRVLGTSDLSSLSPGGSGEESISAALDVPPGTYWVVACVDADVLEVDTGNNCAVSLPLTVGQSNRPIDINPGLNDAWYNPDMPGQGFFINVLPDGNQLFLAWFTFDIERPDDSVPYVLGDPGQRWLIALGTYERGVASLELFQNEGGVFNEAEPVPTESPYGSAQVTFSDCNHGVVEFEIPAAGQYGEIPITRVASDNVRSCEDQLGANGNRWSVSGDEVEGETAAVSSFRFNSGLNDAWFDPAVPGQGFFFNVFPDRESTFVSWFTYDTERPDGNVPSQLGEPGLRWLTAFGQFDGDGSGLTLYQVADGVFNSGDPAPSETEYGSLSLQFDDCNSGEVSYDIPSLSLEGAIPVRRVAADGIPACEKAQKGRDAMALQVSPRDKSVLDNFCSGAGVWQFDWPDVSNASGYVVELWRDDSLRPMRFNVAASAFEYAKNMVVPAAHLAGWKWRYQPQFALPGHTAEFSRTFTFDVGACGS